MPYRKIRDCDLPRRGLMCFVAGVTLWSLPFPVLAQPDKSFFDGKAIRFLVASGPGATTDISARLVARYLGKHMPGNPGIVVQNMSGGGGLVAANYLFNVAKPDGLTIAAIRAAKTPPRFGQSGTGSISYVFANLIERALDLKIKNVTGFQSGRDTDL